MSNPTNTAQSSLIYGASGTRKTTQVTYFADFIAEVTGGRIIRVISAETAGAEPLLPYIESGVIEVLWLSRDMHPRAAVRKLGRGLWPKMKDGIPLRDAQGSMIWEKMTPETNVGGYAVEGLTSIADLISSELKSYAATGAGVQGAKEGTGLAGAGYTDDGETFGQGSQGQVGAVQDSIMEMLREMPKNLYAHSGGKIIHVLFTAHEARGQDDITGQSLFGPGTIGKAITGKLFKEVGTALHFDTETVPVVVNGKAAGGNVTKIYAYFQKHPDADQPNVKWDCKPRIPATPEAFKAMNEKWPGGRFELTFESHLGTYLRFQDEVHQQAMEALKKRRDAMMASQAPKTPPANEPRVNVNSQSISGRPAGLTTQPILRPGVGIETVKK